jgi:2'-5' RNA ligase
METVRAFLALEVSREVKRKIRELQDEIDGSGADVKLVGEENMHVTLKFLGDIDETTVGKVAKVMRAVRSEAFLLEVTGAGAFPTARMPRVLWVGAGSGGDNVSNIAKQLEAELTKIGFPMEREFTPHITVGRVRSARNTAALVDILQRNRNASYGSTAVDRIVFKKSVLTPSGPIYSDIGDVRLGQ